MTAILLGAPATVAAAGALAGLLARMRAELLGAGRFTAPTAAAMYAGYAAHGAAVAIAARRRTLPLPAGTALPSAGAGLAVAGAAMTAAGMCRFTGSGQVTGTDAGALVTSGAYRFSRNPQYTGYVLTLAGLGLVRRSGAVLPLAAATAAVYAWWVRVEEAALARTFGASYDGYRRATPRWLGLSGRG